MKYRIARYPKGDNGGMKESLRSNVGKSAGSIPAKERDPGFLEMWRWISGMAAWMRLDTGTGRRNCRLPVKKILIKI